MDNFLDPVFRVQRASHVFLLEEHARVYSEEEPHIKEKGFQGALFLSSVRYEELLTGFNFCLFPLILSHYFHSTKTLFRIFNQVI